MLRAQRRIAHCFKTLVLADRDEFHLRGDDAAPGVVHLADVGTGPGATRQQPIREAHRAQLRVVFARTTEFGAELRQHVGIAALLDPARAQRRQAGSEVDARLRIGIRAGGVVHGDRRIVLAAEQGRRPGQFDLAHRHAQVGARTFDMDLARTRDRPGHGFGKLFGLADQFAGDGIHGIRPKSVRTKRRRARTKPGRRGVAKLPYAGLNRIRFEGSVSTAPRRGTPASGRIRPYRAPAGVQTASSRALSRTAPLSALVANSA